MRKTRSAKGGCLELYEDIVHLKWVAMTKLAPCEPPEIIRELGNDVAGVNGADQHEEDPAYLATKFSYQR